MTGPIMLLALAVWPFAGVLITADDDLPGGFSNPDGKTLPPWKYWQNWALLGIGTAMSGLGFAIDADWRTDAAVVPWIIGSCGLVGGLLLTRHRHRNVAAHDV